jgi:hypothetical protein
MVGTFDSETVQYNRIDFPKSHHSLSTLATTNRRKFAAKAPIVSLTDLIIIQKAIIFTLRPLPVQPSQYPALEITCQQTRRCRHQNRWIAELF